MQVTRQRIVDHLRKHNQATVDELTQAVGLTHMAVRHHLKQGAQADLPARATPILESGRRREIMADIHRKLSGERDLEAWVEGSPLVQVELLVE